MSRVLLCVVVCWRCWLVVVLCVLPCVAVCCSWLLCVVGCRMLLPCVAMVLNCVGVFWLSCVDMCLRVMSFDCISWSWCI